MNDFDEAKKKIEHMVDIQLGDGNWNFSEYMHGLANGLILALQVMNDDQFPQLLQAPDEFLRNLSSSTLEPCEEPEEI